MEISFSSNSITDDYIAAKFGTCHDSPAVVPCAKYCSDHFISIWMRAKWNFHHIWIVMEKLLVKWAPVSCRPHNGKTAYHNNNPYHKLKMLLNMLAFHYYDVIKGAMASQITSLAIVYSTDYSGTDQRKHQSSTSLAFVRGIHRWPVIGGEFLTKRASNTENISIWWRHHVLSFVCYEQAMDFLIRWNIMKNCIKENFMFWRQNNQALNSHNHRNVFDIILHKKNTACGNDLLNPVRVRARGSMYFGL